MKLILFATATAAVLALNAPAFAQSAAEKTGVNAVAMDTATDPEQAAKIVPNHIAIQGNLDPMALLAGGNALADETRSILTASRGRPAIFNLGHGIVPQTPPDHVAKLLELVRAG